MNGVRTDMFTDLYRDLPFDLVSLVEALSKLLLSPAIDDDLGLSVISLLWNSWS